MDVDLSFTAQVIVHGDGLYVRIPRREEKFWEILAGDELRVKVTTLKRDSKLAEQA